MKVQLGKLKEGQQFTTLVTNRSGLVLSNKEAFHGVDYTSVTCQLSPLPGRDPETKSVHPDIVVWIE